MRGKIIKLGNAVPERRPFLRTEMRS